MSKLRIRYIEPVSGTDCLDELASYLKDIKAPESEIEIVTLREGLPSNHLEYQSYEALVTSDVVKIVRDAARQNFDAVVIGCFYDLALFEAREISGNTIVVGPCHAALQLASDLANRVGILIGRDKWRARVERNVRDYGYNHHVVGVRAAGCTVDDYVCRPDQASDDLMQSARIAIAEDKAEAIVLGCTMNFGQHTEMQDELGVPVIDSLLTAVKRAEALALLKRKFDIKPSRIHTMEPPPEKEIAEDDLFSDSNPPIGARMVVSAS